MDIKWIIKKIINGGLILLFVASIIQCSPKPEVLKENEEVILKGRVQEYWSYKIRGEWDKSYLFEHPEYREKVNIVRYINQNGRGMIKWEGFDILELWAIGEEGYVKVNIKYRYIIPMTQKGAFERVAEEKWIKKEGQWYHYQLL